MQIKVRKESFGYIVYDKEFDKFWRFSKRDFKDFKKPKIEDYSSIIPYGSKNFKFKDLSAPLSIGWMLTNECNSKCLHCRANSGRREEGELNTKQIIKILKMLDQAKVMRVVFSGGEPLMKKGIDKILSYASNNTSISIVLGTNSILLDRFLDSAKKVDFIETSIESVHSSKHDYFRNYRGALSKTIKNIRLLKGRVPLRIFTTLSKLNINEINDLTKLTYSLGAREHQFIRYIPTGRGKIYASKFLLTEREYRKARKKIKKLIKRYKGKMVIECVDIKRDHEFNQAYVLIRPNGNLYTYSTHTDDNVLIGNLLKKDLNELWNKGVVNKRAHLMLWTAESIF